MAKTSILRRLARLGALDSDNVVRLVEEKDGGPGSGNFGHSGRPGKIGGSAKGEGGSGNSGASSQGNSGVQSSPTIRPITRQERIDNSAHIKQANMRMADQIFAEKQKWPDGSPERNMCEIWEKTFSGPIVGRPTAEESRKETQKKLSDIHPSLKPYAVERYKRDLANEPQITSDICDIADDLGTQMYGLNYRLKKASNDRIAQKIQENIDDNIEHFGVPLTYEESVDKLGDIVRYTQACTTGNLVTNFERTKAALEAKGYKCLKVKNTWNSFTKKKPYRGLNCAFLSPTGTKFELQFHTPESMFSKELQHGWYEERRDTTNPPTEKRAAELDDLMFNNMRKMKAPRGIERISNYPPDEDKTAGKGQKTG